MKISSNVFTMPIIAAFFIAAISPQVFAADDKGGFAYCDATTYVTHDICIMTNTIHSDLQEILTEIGNGFSSVVTELKNIEANQLTQIGLQRDTNNLLTQLVNNEKPTIAANSVATTLSNNKCKLQQMQGYVREVC